MDLSRKIFLASCVCITFLAVFIGCSVEDRDLETAGVFICRTNDDCHKGSECIKTSNDPNAEGRCTRSDEVKHCHDYDNDGYMGVEDQYVSECGFSSTVLRDHDDNDPTVYPGAPELCDGKDNSGDGCIDGSCEDESGICSNAPDKCKQILMPCWGAGNVSDYDNSVCSAEKIGVNACINGKLTYAKATRNSDGSYNFTPDEAGSCPTSTSQINGYVESEDIDSARCNNIDDNCNGIVDEACVKCDVLLAAISDKNCVATDSGSGISIIDGTSNYNPVKNFCDSKNISCPCLGQYTCHGIENGKPFCGNTSGENVLTLVNGSECLNAFK